MCCGWRWVSSGALVAALLVTPVTAALAAHTPEAQPQARPEAAKLAKQRVEVDRLRHDVATQKSGGQDAASKLRQRDARIAELKKQLRTLQQAPTTANGEH